MTRFAAGFLTGYVLASLTCLGIALLDAQLPADSARGARR